MTTPSAAKGAAISPYVPDFGAELERLRPIELPHGQAAYRIVLPGVIQVGADTVLAMSRKSSLWPMTFGLACCAIEMIASFMAKPRPRPLRHRALGEPAPERRHDRLRHRDQEDGPGDQASLRADAEPQVRDLHGRLRHNGGPYTEYDRVLQGVDKIIPVDVYVPGCPPRPESLLDGFLALQRKIMEEKRTVG